jgi:proteasome lid subunit RPN8/RPN11
VSGRIPHTAAAVDDGVPYAETPSSGFSPAAMEALYEHAFAVADLESAGVLVGSRALGGAPQINAIIPAVQARSSAERATLSYEAWAYVHQAMAKHYPTQEIIGWYVSRPSGGALTAEDIAVHRRYFPEPDHLAVVFDASRRFGALYRMQHGEMALLHEGPVAARYRPQRADQPEGVPWRAAALLAVLGLILGSVLWLAATVTGIS